MLYQFFPDLIYLIIIVFYLNSYVSFYTCTFNYLKMGRYSKILDEFYFSEIDKENMYICTPSVKTGFALKSDYQSICCTLILKRACKKPIHEEVLVFCFSVTPSLFDKCLQGKQW